MILPIIPPTVKSVTSDKLKIHNNRIVDKQKAKQKLKVRRENRLRRKNVFSTWCPCIFSSKYKN